MSEAEHDYLSLNLAFSFIIFILLFLEKNFEKCSCQDTDGCYPYFEPPEWGWGAMCSSQHPLEQRGPLSSSHHPVPAP